MRRSGTFALITYILYTVIFGGLTLWLLHWTENEGEGLLGFAPATLVIALILGLQMVLAIGGLVALVFKLLHMATGLVIFAIPCILIDGYLAFSAVNSIIEVGRAGEFSSVIIILIPLFFSLGALVSNIKSLQN